MSAVRVFKCVKPGAESRPEPRRNLVESRDSGALEGPVSPSCLAEGSTSGSDERPGSSFPLGGIPRTPVVTRRRGRTSSPRRLAAAVRTDTGRENQYGSLSPFGEPVCAAPVNNVNLSGGVTSLFAFAFSSFSFVDVVETAIRRDLEPVFLPSCIRGRRPRAGSGSGSGDDVDVEDEKAVSCPKIIAGLVIYSVRASLLRRATFYPRGGKRNISSEGERKGEKKKKREIYSVYTHI